MTNVVKAADSAQFLSMIPGMLGFAPSNSLVVVPVAGTRTVGAMRVDMPEPEAWHGFATTVLGMISRLDQADGVAFIAYTDTENVGAFLGGLAACANVFGYRTVDALWVSSERWASTLFAQSGSISEIAMPPAEAAALITEPLRSVRGEDLSHPGTPEAQAVADLLAQGEDALDEMVMGIITETDPVEAMDSFITNEGGPSPEALAALALWVSRPALRDVCLIDWVYGLERGIEALEAQMAWDEGISPYPPELAMVMWGEGPRPDSGRLKKAHAVLHYLASIVDGEYKAGALSLLAWFSWARGMSSEAERWAGEALAINPDHGLSEIVRSFVNAGHLPDWAFHK